jgi:hypothetical protein
MTGFSFWYCANVPAGGACPDLSGGWNWIDQILAEAGRLVRYFLEQILSISPLETLAGIAKT